MTGSLLGPWTKPLDVVLAVPRRNNRRSGRRGGSRGSTPSCGSHVPAVVAAQATCVAVSPARLAVLEAPLASLGLALRRQCLDDDDVVGRLP